MLQSSVGSTTLPEAHTIEGHGFKTLTVAHCKYTYYGIEITNLL